jgi:hypothetical protein
MGSAWGQPLVKKGVAMKRKAKKPSTKKKGTGTMSTNRLEERVFLALAMLMESPMEARAAFTRRFKKSINHNQVAGMFNTYGYNRVTGKSSKAQYIINHLPETIRHYVSDEMRVGKLELETKRAETLIQSALQALNAEKFIPPPTPVKKPVKRAVALPKTVPVEAETVPEVPESVEVVPEATISETQETAGEVEPEVEEVTPIAHEPTLVEPVTQMEGPVQEKTDEPAEPPEPISTASPEVPGSDDEETGKEPNVAPVNVTPRIRKAPKVRYARPSMQRPVQHPVVPPHVRPSSPTTLVPSKKREPVTPEQEAVIAKAIMTAMPDVDVYAIAAKALEVDTANGRPDMDATAVMQFVRTANGSVERFLVKHKCAEPLALEIGRQMRRRASGTPFDRE